MSHDRFVLLGLARPRAPWFAEVSRWATSATISAEFVKCVSAEELRARLASGRPWSAVLLDGAMPAVDRDLIAAAADAGCAAIVVYERDDAQRWLGVGAVGVLPAGFDRGALLEVLDAVAETIGRPLAVTPSSAAFADVGSSALVVAVCGAGGTGVSTSAAALAQGLAVTGRSTVLADLARHAEQAMLHDVRDVVPGIQELVEAHRNGVPSATDVQALTFSIVDRGYSLLLGLRRSRYWPALRPRAFAMAFVSLQRAFDAVVYDVTADFESEGDAGSADVEERNVAARTAVLGADAVVVVGRPGVKGIHALVRVLGELTAVGVTPARILPVVTVAPRSPRARAEITAAVAVLARPVLGGAMLASPLFLPARPVEQALRDGAPLPAPLPARLVDAVDAVLRHAGPVVHQPGEPQPIAAGSLGTFTTD